MRLLKTVVKNNLDRLGYDLRPIVREQKVFDYVFSVLKEIEKSTSDSTTRADVLKQLRTLGLSDFGLLMLSIPNSDLPRLSALLPRMAKEEVQMSWTGASGLELLTQTIDFVRSLSYNFTRATGRSLESSNILDFGCGYGRITRLMYYFANEDQVYGVDPWDKSIEICRADGLTKNFLLSKYLPSQLPVPSCYFDLIFAFSVFTHLSEKATLMSLNTISDYLKPDGLIAITIRPIEYWDVDRNATKLGIKSQQKATHIQEGFSFLPHDRPTVDGDITYGDTSISLDWLRNSFPKLKIAGVDRSLSDPYQIYIFLQKQ